MKRMTMTELAEKLRKGDDCVIVDVRSPGEYASEHLAVAKNIPLDELSNGKPVEELNADGKLVVCMCRTGRRATMAAEKLASAGYNVAVLDASVEEWRSSGLPVERGRGTISIERQVRIAAGLLILAGTIGAAFVHPAFLAIPAFVGAGLVFAGITDWCGMGLLLARAPWNRVRSGQSAKSACCQSAPEAASRGDSEAASNRDRSECCTM